MIDSVLLKLNNGQFRLREQNKFRDAKYQKGKGFSINSKFCNEYREQWKKQGIYCPSFELLGWNQGQNEAQNTLEIQVSLPKLVHGTNLYDIDISDLNMIFKRLLFFLDDLGIETTEENLRKAIVKRADFSKIIKLPDYLGRADEVIRLLARFDYKPQSEFRFREYSNGHEGIVIKFWNSTQGYAIYCKFGEIINNGFTKQEKKILEFYKEGKLKRSALKFELSLQRKDSLDAVVSRQIKIPKKKDFCLIELFEESLARNILCAVFEKVFSNVAVGLITLSQMEDHQLLAYLERSGMTQAKQEKLYYWVRMATKFGIAGTWEHLELKHSGGTVSRRRKEIALILQELGQISGNVPNLVGFLRDEHNKFEIFKPKTPL